MDMFLDNSEFKELKFITNYISDGKAPKKQSIQIY